METRHCANKQAKGHFGKFEWGYADGFQNALLPLSLQYMPYITCNHVLLILQWQ